MKDESDTIKVDCPSCCEPNGKRRQYQLFLDQRRIILTFVCGECGTEYQAVFDQTRVQTTEALEYVFATE